MTSKEVEDVVFQNKPEFGKIIQTHGDETLISYWNNHFVPPNNTYTNRHTELSNAIAQIATERLGEKGRQFVHEYLKVNSFVSTADHHHLLCHPFFLSANLLQSLANKSHNINTVLVLGCAGISPDNSSFPRGLFYHNEQLEQERIPFFTLKHRKIPVYGLPGYTKKDIRDEDIEKIVEQIYFRPEILERTKYREQTTIANFYAWKKIPGQEQTNLVYIDQESVATRLIALLLQSNKKNVIKKILTTREGLDAFETHFKNIIGSFNTTNDKGTFLFWAINNGKRERLMRNGMQLSTNDNTFTIDISSESITKALNNETIYPSMALSLSVLSFYYGLTLGGGFSQVGYLSQMKQAYKNVLKDISERDELQKVETIETNHFSGEGVLATIGGNRKRTSATLFDLILYKNQKIKERIEKHSKKLTLHDSIVPMMSEYYKIITGNFPVLHSISNSIFRSPLSALRFSGYLPRPLCHARKKLQCVHCGNAPTNHTVEWINQTMAILHSPFNKIIVRSFFGRLASWLAPRLELQLFYLFKLLRLAQFIDGDGVQPVTERSRLIFEEGARRGFSISQVYMLGRPTEHFITNIHGEKMVYESIPRPKNLETDSIFWLDDKLILKKKLQGVGIPVPSGGSFITWFSIRRAFQKMHKPVIIKPRLGSRGRHTTTHIYTERELRQAIRIAKQLCTHIIMEEHLKGSVYRATVIGGKVVGILAGDQPKITGNGISSISILIEQKNKQKPDRVKDVIVDDKVIDFLARMGYTLDTIIPKGLTIDLSEKIGLAYGGSARELLPVTHPKIIETMEHAARVVNDPVIGFDFIIENPTQDPDTQKWGIIEANSLPFINLHFEPMEGPSINVAPYIWDLWE